MRSRALRVAVTLALGLSPAGCGTSILLSYPLDMPFLRANNDIISGRPLGPPVTRTRVTLDSGPLRVMCETQEAVPLVRYTRLVTFDGVGRLVVGFMAVSEAAGATMLALNAKGMAGPWIAAGLLAADATGAMIYAIAERDRYIERSWVGNGYPRRTATCPPGITVGGGGWTAPIGPSGRPEGDLRGMINAVLHLGATISVSFGGRFGVWTPDAEDRCALAHEIQHPQAASFCPSSGGWPRPSGGASSGRWKPGRVSIEVGGSLGP